MSDNFFSKFDSEYFSLIIFLEYLLILLLMLIFVTKMTLLEKNKICRTFRAVGHLGTLQPYRRIGNRCVSWGSTGVFLEDQIYQFNC